jgi:hypothetical protein
MGDLATRTEESLAAIRASLEQVQERMGSLDARLGLLDSASQQVAGQLELNSKVVGNHSRIMDAIERRQESLAQQMAATAEAVGRLGGSKAPSAYEMEDGEGDPLHGAGKGLLSASTWRGETATEDLYRADRLLHGLQIRVSLVSQWGRGEAGSGRS